MGQIFRFRLYRVEVAKRRVFSETVVENFDVIKDVGPQFILIGKEVVAHGGCFVATATPWLRCRSSYLGDSCWGAFQVARAIVDSDHSRRCCRGHFDLTMPSWVSPRVNAACSKVVQINWASLRSATLQPMIMRVHRSITADK